MDAAAAGAAVMDVLIWILDHHAASTLCAVLVIILIAAELRGGNR